MNHNLLASVRDSIEQDWLERSKHCLGNPDLTPHQVLRAYVEELDITVACLNDAIEWDCWAGNDAGDDIVLSDAPA
jgi:hypothetical protein